MAFLRSAVDPGNDCRQAYYLCFSDEDILLQSVGGRDSFPFLTVEKAREVGFNEKCFIGFLDGKPCYALAQKGGIAAGQCQWVRLRDFYVNGENELSEAAGYARQILDWNSNFRFCGRCAAETLVLPSERARKCPKCGLVNYPRISPAVITAVIKGDQILLARGRNYRDKEMFSVLAGFLEPGESLEGAARREVMEEAGIEIGNIRYFGSQSWPFPDSLMIGFTADYHGGHIKIDENEIAEAGWFKADALPKVPHKRSLSSELIQWFVRANRK